MGRQASDKIKVAMKGGQRELTIPIPSYATEMRATLDDKGHPIHTEMNVGGKLYSADFSKYGETDTMEEAEALSRLLPKRNEEWINDKK